jgi:hypothetical protein
MAPSGFPGSTYGFELPDDGLALHLLRTRSILHGALIILWLTNSVLSELFTAHLQPRTFFKDFWDGGDP